MANEVPIRRVDAQAYRVPIAGPEADGTIDWDSTTMVVTRVGAGDAIGVGYTHADAAATSIDVAPIAGAGVIKPDLTRPGHGLHFERQDAERFKT